MEASGQSGGQEHAPSAEDLAKAGQVSAAAAAAVEGAESEQEARERAKAAIKDESKKVQLELSDEDCNKIVDMLIERLNAMGAFDPRPPEAPTPPPEPTPEQTAAAEAAAAAETVPPEKLTWAERHFGRVK